MLLLGQATDPLPPFSSTPPSHRHPFIGFFLYRCHEIGHGFGLPHTDENFVNENQGNCLDYTMRPESNMHPGDVNFYKLLSMYTNYYEADNNDNGNNNQQGNYDQQQDNQQENYDQQQENEQGNNNNKNNNNKNNNKNKNNNRHVRRARSSSDTQTVLEEGMDEDGTPWKRVLHRHYLWNWDDEEE